MRVFISGLFYLVLLTFNGLSIANPLVDAAKDRLKHVVIYDGSYQSIAYPMGDVAANKGVCTDVIIRSYRALGIDLQQLVHEDMDKHFGLYPKIWGLNKPDSNIDHRRVPNLEVFFKRFGVALPITQNPRDYQPGDIVSWRLSGNNRPHIGIVSDQKAASGNYEIIHNIGWGVRSEDMLFKHPITGHYRY
ncbi:DUF1287 domain-containing protein [Marinicella sp. S1101]|nr:DUF1287 domain-containing protein [Marinicella marina]MCX7554320.1 DUF1287 domain-containing protein [Marinicella marina]MDJ1138689.1 DUF1287 domain-containing protein [Marinicella marina]